MIIVLNPRYVRMGKKSLEIAGPNIDKNIGMLQRAYAFEMQTSHYFQYMANNIESQ
jgi:ferritin-like protein